MITASFLRALALSILLIACALAWQLAQAQDDGAEDEPGGVIPGRHFQAADPANLTDDEALGIYRKIARRLGRGYALSHDPVAARYQTWTRYNRTPYRSATHGERFVNNYGNRLASDYGRLDEVESLPSGAVLAKDSFAVTEQGDVHPGPLFVMEKMSAGFNPAHRDWRYRMIMPDGSEFGDSAGPGPEKIEFCHACHRKAGAANDHLFFVPPAYRVGTAR